MMKASKIIMALLTLFVFTNAQAGTTYLEFDKTCMDRYEYRYNDFNSGFGHIVYHIRLNDQEKIILEVGIESRVNRDVKPSETQSCGEVKLNERFIRELNKGDEKVFMVVRTQSGYNVSKVGLGSYAQISEDYYGISSYDNMFVYKYKDPAGNKNIASRGSDAKVFFNGVVSYECPKRYQFTKTLDRAGRNYTEMIVIPEIGVIEEKTGFNQVDAENNKLMLVSINGVPFNQYSGTFCSNRSKDYAPIGSFYNNVGQGRDFNSASDKLIGLESGSSDPVYPTTPPATTSTETGPVFPGTSPSTTGPVNQPPNTGRTYTDPNTGAVYHHQPSTGSTTTYTPPPSSSGCKVYKNLDKGLYYDWYTGQLANGTCQGNTYVNGVMAEYDASAVFSTSPQPTTTYPSTSTTTYTPPATAPAPTTQPTYRPTPTPVVSSSGCAKYSSPGIHVVQKNETLYGISRMYGVTVNQVKSWNGIGRKNLIRPCTELVVAPKDFLVSKGQPATEATPYVTNTDAYHTVSKGETIYMLANQYGLTPSKFREINALSTNDMIYVGQKLRVTTCNCPTSTGVAAVERDPANLPVPAEYGNTAPKRLVVDEMTEKGSVNYYSGTKRRIHVVSENETIFSIAKKYGISAQQIRYLNDLEENEVIIPFQRLYLN